ncbi:hypothetical protein [Enterococcus sp. LJL51]|uniref:hypothetical protein n=1 Tax=Enterococcus sp. LJL51 TaxID=3416656 RepID=UPI003CF7208B
MHSNNTILNQIQILRNKPEELIIGDLTYVAFCTYIEGYIDGINQLLSFNLREDITKYFESKGNIHTNYYWTNQIKHRNEEKTDTELINILLDVTEEYFMEKFKFCSKLSANEVKKKIYNWLDGLKNRPKMYVDEISSILLYLEAFLDGLNVYSNRNFKSEINQSSCQKTNRLTTIHWTEEISELYDSKDIAKILIEHMEKYFKNIHIETVLH